jgi:glycosyltransferase involved in cell wall biosynthesis
VLVLVENLSVPFDRRVWQECQSLTRAGYEVVVVCPQGRAVDEAPHERRDGVTIHRYPLVAANGGVGTYAREYAAALWQTWRLARRLDLRYRFALVHACNPPDLLLLTAWILRRRGAALVFDHHDLVPELYLAKFRRGRDLGYQAAKATERLAFSLADVILSTNDSYRAVALGRGRKAIDDVFVVRNGPDLTRLRLVDRDSQLRRGRRFLLAYVGLMGWQDGVDQALHALARLQARRRDWFAVFAGDGEALPAMRELTARLGLEGSVSFVGRLDDDGVRKVLSTCDLCLAPEPTSPLNDLSTLVKIGEYMAMSRPIVAYELVESRVTAGRAAAYARADDEDSFARCIEELLDDDVRRNRMAVIGRARVERSLSWEHSEQSLLAAYRRALVCAARRGGRAARALEGGVPQASK